MTNRSSRSTVLAQTTKKRREDDAVECVLTPEATVLPTYLQVSVAAKFRQSPHSPPSQRRLQRSCRSRQAEKATVVGASPARQSRSARGVWTLLISPVVYTRALLAPLIADLRNTVENNSEQVSKKNCRTCTKLLAPFDEVFILTSRKSSPPNAMRKLSSEQERYEYPSRVLRLCR